MCTLTNIIELRYEFLLWVSQTAKVIVFFLWKSKASLLLSLILKTTVEKLCIKLKLFFISLLFPLVLHSE